ncbi:MAG: glucose-6-phosphate isomerase, partial [Rhodoluna sp.]
IASRIANKDFTVWGKEAESESAIRLGWVNSASDSAPLIPEILALRESFLSAGVNRFVLCGMGGSSLAPEVITKNYGVELVVLDSTEPEQVLNVVAKDIERTAIVVSSKSGSTVETDSQKRIFEEAFTKAGIEKTERIIIVTDPGSPMEAAAKADGYRIFNADPTVGGRYSALTAFGLVPSGLAGANIAELVGQAQSVSALLSSDDSSNPGLVLGAAMARTAGLSTYKDKLGLLADSSLPGFGDWAEQLIAESTGKIDKGVLPVVLEAKSFEVSAEQKDLLLAHVSATGNPSGDLSVSGPLGAQFLLWEYATVVAGYLLGVNPFDQPDVESAKIAARGMLEQRAAISSPAFVDGGIEVRALNLDLSAHSDISSAIASLLGELAEDGFVSVHAYLNRESELSAELLRNAIASKTSRPTTFGWAPRFLHSTGQYHKGGPKQGVYLQLISKTETDVQVPGRDFSLGELIASQAAGDAKVLADLGRPVLSLTLSNPISDYTAIVKAIG